MMDQCFTLGIALAWSVMTGLMARAWGAALAGLILFANWFLWSGTILASLKWEPWGFAMLIDGVTAWALWRLCGQPLLAASSAHLVTLHGVRAMGWISYEVYYDYGWTVGLLQAGLVMAAALAASHSRRAVL